ncbi:glycoside hydrolase family 19 protein [Lentzea sp. NBRC 102530]|uniref:glycoside hydrolase family 19 protein n=1 Tax=Lentzea sp. NBRC 102530 TaxID=3032201 RepID=UPI0024A5B145|nr:glycoside hydrolase family 19 protein [Lentzea sp. NBRC 102530]GLY54113.1 chitinase [Lentzea sp. NBRC 102530]
MLRKRILASLAAVAMAATVAVLAPTASAQAEVSAQACSGNNWVAGQWYTAGTTVRYTDGKYYTAEHDNPGYDPIISTWYWEPANCGGGGGGGTCSAPDWVAGQWYPAGSIVRYAPNGLYYIAENENPGYDPTISTWYWRSHTCNGGGGGGGGGGNIVSEAQFNQMFPGRNSFYTYQGFIDATKTIPAFGTVGSDAVKKQEFAAFLANASHETGGLVYIEEINKNNDLCDESRPYGCPAGTYAYYGRGPIQLSWNFNYQAAGEYLGLNLLQNPYQVAQNSTTAWRTAIWYWMTQWGPGSMTPHMAMVNGAGFGQTIRSINGSLECDGRNPAQVQSRVSKYQQFTSILGVAPGGNLYC